MSVEKFDTTSNTCNCKLTLTTLLLDAGATKHEHTKKCNRRL
jgi:hypothetical protein